MTNSYQKEIQTKLTKGLLDMIILQILEKEPMHGYQIMTKIRKTFGANFGASTIYPLLGTLESKGYAESEWSIGSDRPRKVFHITNEGQNVLKFTEGSLNLICKNFSTNSPIDIQVTTRSKPGELYAR